MENEMMNNEVETVDVDTIEEGVTYVDPKSLLIGGVVVGGGILAYRKLIKPGIKKVKGEIEKHKIKKEKVNKDEPIETIIVEEKDVTVESK